jgi:hypothetical protein
MFGSVHPLGQAIATALLLAAIPAHAQEGLDLLSAETLTIAGDARIVGVDGEKSWIDRGHGRTRFDPNDPGGGFAVRPWLAEADLIWQPRFTWSLTGTLVVSAQHGQDKPVDLTEAVLTFKPLLSSETKVTARAGLYWPAISLEHSGPEWAVTDTITPSAINSWIGDEIKVGGTEVTMATGLGAHRVAATLGAFGLNDTSGTLLSFRGWALHDQKATAFGHQPLPPLTGMMRNAQAPRTRPVIEIDDRIGWYGKLGWSPSDWVELQLFHYDNRGDPEAVTPSKQWGWRTRFTQAGAIFSNGALTFKAQAITGRTEMGKPRPVVPWIDTRFRSAFLLATRQFERGSVSARAEAFGTDSRGSVVGAHYSDEGWGLTLAGKRRIGPYFTLLGEFLHVESAFPARRNLGLPRWQKQNQVQLSLRVRL